MFRLSRISLLSLSPSHSRLASTESGGGRKRVQLSQSQSSSSDDKTPFRYPIQYDHPDYFDEEKAENEMRRVFDVCHGCRRCFNLCSSFPKLFSFVDESKTGELDSIPASKFKEVVDDCTLCDLCFLTKCPYVPPHSFNIDFPHLILRYRAIENAKRNGVASLTSETSQTKNWLQPVAPQFQTEPGVSRELTKKATSLLQQLYSHQDLVAPLMSRLSPFFNYVLTNTSASSSTFMRLVLEKTFGFHRMAKLPYISAYHSTYLQKAKKKMKKEEDKENLNSTVILYPCCYANYNGPQVPNALADVLEHNDVPIKNIYFGCCGMPQMEQGAVKEVANKAFNISNLLAQQIDHVEKSTGLPCHVVFPVSSCALMLKKEWPLLLPNNKNIAKIAERSFDTSEYVMFLKKQGRLKEPKESIEASVCVHHACHNRAQNTGFKAFELIKLIPGLQITHIQKCSGHGGIWGMQEKHFETGMKVGTPVIRHAQKQLALSRKVPVPFFVASDCPIAADQIVQGIEKKQGSICSDVKSVHPVQLLARAYGYLGNLGTLTPPSHSDFENEKTKS